MWILAYFIFLLVNFHQQAQAVTCDEIISDPIKYFTEQTTYIDYQSNIDQSSKICRTDLRTLITDAKKDYFNTLYNDNKFKYHIDRLKSQSLYGPVDKNDLDSARKYSKLLGNYRLKEIEQYFAEGAKKVSNSNDCGTIDLRSKMGPVQDQGYIGWCHAYTAADLLSFKLGKKISAASLAIYGERKTIEMDGISPVKILTQPESEISKVGSYLVTTLNAGLEKGLCLEEDFPSAYKTNTEENNRMFDFIKQSETNANLVTQIKNLNLPMSIEVRDCIQETAQSLISMKQVQTLTKIRDAVIKNSTATTVFTNMEAKACKQKRIFPKVSIENIGEDRPKIEMIKAIDDQLQKGAPAGAAYFSSFLNSKLVKDGGHGSSVIGRTLNPNTNKCEYLIRNSWGTSCDGIPAIHRCYKGNFWISRDELHRNLIQVTYIK